MFSAAFPVSYRRQDAEYIYALLAAGNSCSLVGLGGVGKSSFLRFLTQPDVKHYYLGSQDSDYNLFVIVNPRDLVNPPAAIHAEVGDAWHGYEIILSRLLRMLQGLDENRLPGVEKVVQAVYHSYQSLFDRQSLLSVVGVRLLETAVFQVMTLDSRLRIVFVLDDFEGFLTIPAHFFQSLRGLRDQFARRIMFITASSQPLDELVVKWMTDFKDKEMMESFVELFYGFTRYLGNLDAASVETLLNREEQRWRFKLDPQTRARLHEITGGHAGLLRRSLPVAGNAPLNLSIEAFMEYMLQERGVLIECHTILDNLTLAEQMALRQLAEGQALEPGTHGLTDKVTVLRQIPLLLAYIRKQAAFAEQDTQIEIAQSPTAQPPRSKPRSPKVFISYRRSGSAMLATLLAKELERYQIEVFVDVRRVEQAGPFADRLFKAIQDCDVFICLLSDETLTSPYVCQEVEHAYTTGKPMIPVFQESYFSDPYVGSDDAITRLLDSDGVHIMDVRNVFIEATIDLLVKMIQNTFKKLPNA